MRAETYGTFAAWATFAVAFTAACFAYKQLNESKQTRESARQPHVAAFLDMNAKNWQWFDLVIKNFGPTTAYNITVKLPPLKVVPYTTNQGVAVAELYVPDTIAMLVPGQEWRTIWDSAIDREELKEKLPSFYVGSLEYTENMDTKAKRLIRPISLNTETFRNTMRFSDEQPNNPVVGILSQIATTLSQYQNEHEGIWVYPLDSQTQRMHLAEQAEVRREKLKRTQELVDRVLHKRTKLDHQADFVITDGEETTAVELKNYNADPGAV
ncbi:hypothetical protein [Mycobacterium kubicae]|uniref:hypothetical protein n=1 Tax=Mycobacterium kubicae TaxID=120959 RepID=UPI001041D009|nr:hypothetical protein [Mycobacterium kubicae]